MTETLEAHHWYIRGRVQGVSFRWFARKAAERLKLRGSVRNLGDGRVEVRVIGDPEAIEKLRKQMETGPPNARVQAIDEHPLDDDQRAYLENLDGFEIEL